MAESFIPLTTSNLGGSISSITSAIDSNFSTLSTKLNDVLSLVGNSPNQMTSNLDMNSKNIINLPFPSTSTSPVRLQDISNQSNVVGATGAPGAPGLQGPPGTAVSSSGLLFPNNIVYSGPSSASNSWMYLGGQAMSGVTYTGDLAGWTAPFYIFVGNDVVDTTTHGHTGMGIIHVEDAPAAGFSGGRVGIGSDIVVVGSPTNTIGGDMVGVSGFVRIAANLLGTSGVATNYAGGVFGSNFQCILNSAATYIGIINGCELNVAVNSGASVGEKHGLTIVKTDGDHARADFDDSGLNFNDQDNSTVTWKYGISFGAYSHKWPFGTDSTLIVAQTRQLPAVVTPVALNGIDFSGVTFSGAPIIMPLITPASSSATGTIGSIVWDASNIYICTSTNTWKKAALSTF